MTNFFRQLTFGKLRQALRDPQEPESRRALMKLFWKAIVIGTILACAGAIAWNAVRLENALSSFDAASTVTQSAISPIDPSAFGAVVQAFALRQARYDAIASTTPAIADPSK